MGRHHGKLPDHLYLSPPQTPTSPPSSFSSFKLATASSAALISETSSAVGERIPGFKTSAAFLINLRANLSLASVDTIPSSSGYSTPASQPSGLNTPDSLHPLGNSNIHKMTSFDAGHQPPLPPTSSLADILDISPPDSSTADPSGQHQPSSQSQQNDIPPLTTRLAKTDAERVDALRLIADSVAQQRQLASSALIFHPLVLSLIVLLIALVQKLLSLRRNIGPWGTTDWAFIGTTSVGLCMAGLVGVRWCVSGYIDHAERVGTWNWLGDRDEVWVTVFGQEIIGALVLKAASATAGKVEGNGSVTRPNPPQRNHSKRNNKASSSSAGENIQGVIRAWTVKRRYRSKEIGTALLEEAVKTCRSRGWSGPVFAPDHANAHRVLWDFFNGWLDKGERRAKRKLDQVIKEHGVGEDDISGVGGGGRRKK